MLKRICAKCKKKKNVEKFYSDDPATKSNYYNCIVCIKERMRKYYINNKEKVCGIVKKYRDANKEKISKKQKAYYIANRARLLKKANDRYKRNKAES